MGIKLKSVKCVQIAYVERPVVKQEFNWAIYNKISGAVVGLTYNETMARVMTEGLNGNTSPYTDGYEYTEVWNEDNNTGRVSII